MAAVAGSATALRRFDRLPDGLLDCTSIELVPILGGPALIYLDGARKPPLFVTVLQHGNEPTGFEAIQQVLKKYQAQGLPRAMWLFIANIEGAASGLRVGPGQADYNRSWPGTLNTGTPEAALMQEVVETVTAGPLFASVDLHNNTGSNPHYGCVNVLEPEFLHLASLFSRTVVYFRQPVGVQSLAMADHCPAVTLECGQAGENAALTHAIDYLDACLHLHHLPETPVADHDMHLLHTIAVAKMKPGVSFGFDGEDADVCFRPDIDTLNFGRLEPGETLARVAERADMPISVTDDNGKDVTSTLFTIEAGRLTARVPIIPSMATRDASIIRQDCLFYIMEEMALPRT